METKMKALELIEEQMAFAVRNYFNSTLATDVLTDLAKLQAASAEHIASAESIAPEDVISFAKVTERLAGLQGFISELSALYSCYDSAEVILDEDGAEEAPETAEDAAAEVVELKKVIAAQNGQIDRLTALLEKTTGTSKTE